VWDELNLVEETLTEVSTDNAGCVKVPECGNIVLLDDFLAVEYEPLLQEDTLCDDFPVELGDDFLGEPSL
jgi:hypothetical protein